MPTYVQWGSLEIQGYHFSVSYLLQLESFVCSSFASAYQKQTFRCLSVTLHGLLISQALGQLLLLLKLTKVRVDIIKEV